MHLQKQKVYVQDRLRENGELVWKLLQGGGHFYVCGDAAHMAGSVEQALLHIIDEQQVQQAVGCWFMCNQPRVGGIRSPIQQALYCAEMPQSALCGRNAAACPCI